MPTPSEFGPAGEAPTHPALLDDLAARFVAKGWSLKWLHREILASATWRQSSLASDGAMARDPQNRLLARQSRWRLEAEFIRDAALVHAGLLVRTVGGPSVKPYQPEGYWEFLNFPKRTWKAPEKPLADKPAAKPAKDTKATKAAKATKAT